jgi:hypothetical protein
LFGNRVLVLGSQKKSGASVVLGSQKKSGASVVLGSQSVAGVPPVEGRAISRKRKELLEVDFRKRARI